MIVYFFIQIVLSVIMTIIEFLALWHLAAFGDFWTKDTETHVALRENFSHLVSVTDLVESSKDVASLLVCSLKKILWLGCGFFVSDVISRGRLGHLGLLYLALGANH